MSYEHKNNTGSLFGNDNRSKDTDPHAKGSALIDGKEYWMSGWKNKTKNGKDWMNFSFTEKGGQTAPRPKDEPKDEPEDFDDDLPF